MGVIKKSLATAAVSVLLILVSVAALSLLSNPVNAPETVGSETVIWENTKIINVSNVVIESPKEITSCSISPDNGDGWDNCTAYFTVFNGLANYQSNKQNYFNKWAKENEIRNLAMQYTKNIISEKREVSKIVNETYNETYNQTMKIFGDFSASIPNLDKGETLAVKMEFQKQRWKSNSFNISAKFGANEITLDPDVSACGTLDAAGTYTLNQSITSTGTCITIGANDIILDGAGYLINYSQNSVGYAVNNSGGYDNITIKNLDIVLGNRSLSAGIDAIVLTGTTQSTILNNTIRQMSTSSTEFSGISLGTGSNFNNVTNNTVINTGTRSWGITLVGSNNTLIGNDLQQSSGTAGGGLQIKNAKDTLVSGGSITSANGNAYNFESGTVDGSTVNFTNTNFTAARVIRTYGQGMWFVYNNQTDGNIWLKTARETGGTIKTMTRTLNTWSQNNMIWNDTPSANYVARYNFTGLSASADYEVWNTSAGTITNSYSLTTDSEGVLPSFTIALNGNTEIAVNTSASDTASPTYSLNSTNSTIAGTSILHSLYWQDNTALSGYIFSFDNGTGTFVNDSFVLMSGTGNWSNVTKSVNLTAGATIQWAVYANDSNDNWNTSAIYSYVTTSSSNSYSVNVSDSFLYNELRNNAYFMSRLGSDSFSYFDALLRNQGILRLPLSAVIYSEAIDGTGIFGRRLSDALSYGEVLYRMYLAQKTGTDTLSYNEFAEKTGSLKRINTDSVAYYESLYNAGLLNRNPSDTITVAEFLEKIGLFNRQSGDSIAYYEYMRRLGIFNKGLSDTLTFSDITNMGESMYSKTVSDSFTYYEILIKLGILNRDLSDFLSYYESTSRYYSFGRQMSESIATISDSLKSTYMANRIISNSMTAYDSAARIAFFRFTEDNQLTYNEISLISSIFNREPSDILLYNELISKLSLLNRGVSDTVSYNDQMARLAIMIRRISSTVSITESLSIPNLPQAVNILITEPVSISDVVQRTAAFIRLPYDSLTVWFDFLSCIIGLCPTASIETTPSSGGGSYVDIISHPALPVEIYNVYGTPIQKVIFYNDNSYKLFSGRYYTINVKNNIPKPINITLMTNVDWLSFDLEAKKAKNVTFSLYPKGDLFSKDSVYVTLVADDIKINNTDKLYTWKWEGYLMASSSGYQNKTLNVFYEIKKQSPPIINTSAIIDTFAISGFIDDSLSDEGNNSLLKSFGAFIVSVLVITYIFKRRRLKRHERKRREAEKALDASYYSRK